MRLLAFAFTIVFVWTGPSFAELINIPEGLFRGSFAGGILSFRRCRNPFKVLSSIKIIENAYLY